MIWIYDSEIFENFFSVTFKNPKSQEIKKFIIFESINQGGELVEFIQNNSSSWLIGYNSFNFDNQILNYINKMSFDINFLHPNEITRNIYQLAKAIIESEFGEYRYNLPFRYIDLMKLGGFKKSLKLIGVSLKWPKLQDIPFSENSIIREENIESIMSYNLNDVLITEQLYENMIDRIKLRYDTSRLYEIDAYSESDSGLANRLLEKFYSDATGLPISSFKNLRTQRNFIKFDWVVFDNINFKSPDLINLLEEIKSYTYYKNQPFFKKSFTYDGIKYKFGIGGLHSEDGPAIFEENDDYYIIDADMGSMYPTILINHELVPEHLGKKFLSSYKTLRNKRLEAKAKNKGCAEDESLKIVLNSTFGKTLNKNHWLFDPIVGLKITINGQLYILSLIEDLVLNGFKVISANTDGVITLVDKTKLELYNSILKEWEYKCNFVIETAIYKKYIRRDVNNYIAMYKDSSYKSKTKGIFSPEINLYKGYDKPIVSKALYEFFVNNIPIIDTIDNSKDILDFCIAKRIDDKFTNEYHDIKNGNYQKEILQRSVRYYVSKNGGILLKTCEEENKITNYEANKRVTIFY